MKAQLNIKHLQTGFFIFLAIFILPFTVDAQRMSHGGGGGMRGGYSMAALMALQELEFDEAFDIVFGSSIAMFSAS